MVKGIIMKSFRKWLVNLFEGMAYALVHPMKNSLPPEIGTHSYRDKPYKRHRGLWYSQKNFLIKKQVNNVNFSIFFGQEYPSRRVLKHKQIMLQRKDKVWNSDALFIFCGIKA